MLFSALALFCCTALPFETPVAAAPSIPSVAVEETIDAPPLAPVREALPEAPAAKPEVVAASEEAKAESFTPGSLPFGGAVKSAASGSYETARERKIWYGLMAASHAAAGLDAWTTRRAISGGYGNEGDPLMRPFANSGAIYAATQASPAVLDFVGRRMMRSNHEMIRRFWWLPQAAGGSLSVVAAVHNYRLIP